jgi:hypothetical protein
MMDPALKEKFLVALRSGEYSYTSGRLKDKCGYCALGVLAVVGGLTIDELGGVLRDKDGNKADYKPFHELIGITENDLEAEQVLCNIFTTSDSAGFEAAAKYVEENL